MISSYKLTIETPLATGENKYNVVTNARWYAFDAESSNLGLQASASFRQISIEPDFLPIIDRNNANKLTANDNLKSLDLELDSSKLRSAEIMLFAYQVCYSLAISKILSCLAHVFIG